MIFGYIKSAIHLPERLIVPMDIILEARYDSYVRVVEDDISKNITIYFEKGKQIISFNEESRPEASKKHAMESFINLVAKAPNENKVVFRGLRTLGDTIQDARSMYWHILKKRVDAIFLDSEGMNTSEYFSLLRLVPNETEMLAVRLFDWAYTIEDAQSKPMWKETNSVNNYSQLNRKGKKQF